MVDIALETREQAAILAVLDHFGKDFAARGGDLPKDSEKEHTYLAAKVAYEARRHRAAPNRCSPHVDRQSRFYAAALYFRGLIHARRGHLASARRSLCEIVEQVDQDRFTFFIDGRYYGIKDLAYLALGRIAHEQEKYDDAYYFYFRVPEDSERLPDALFEASWSMFQAGEYEAANAFLEEFDRVVRQDAARARRPAAARDDRSQVVPVRRRARDAGQAGQDLRPAAGEGRGADQGSRKADRASTGACSASARSAMPRDPIIELLKIDPRFFKFYADIVALDREAGLVPGEVAVWDELTATSRAATRVERLRGGAAGQRRRGAAAARRRRSRDGAPGRATWRTRPAAPRGWATSGAGRFAKEAETTLALAVEARKLRAQLVAATSTIANQALVDLDKRLRELLRRARLTHIDAVIGKKKKLEIEIANLRQGRFPADLFATLQLEGLDGRRRGILALRR